MASQCYSRESTIIPHAQEAATINPFDANIVTFVNQFAQRSALLDAAIAFFSNQWLFKGAPVMALFWWVWFRDSPSTTRDREFILSGFAMSALTLVLARSLALSLPFRERPRYIAQHFRLPTGTSDFHLIHWSSFPSDNAAFYFSLATCLFLISHKLGVLAYCHALFLVCLPRIYLGLHYPTDILGGALLGIAVACLSSIDTLRSAIARLPLRWMTKAPASFYLCAFLGTFLFATEFMPVRETLVAVWKLAHGKVPDLP